MAFAYTALCQCGATRLSLISRGGSGFSPTLRRESAGSFFTPAKIRTPPFAASSAEVLPNSDTNGLTVL